MNLQPAPEVRGARREKLKCERSAPSARRGGAWLRDSRPFPTHRPRLSCKAYITVLTAGFFAAGLACAQAGQTELRRIDFAIAPPLSLTDLSGRPVDLSAQRGRIVFLHFFATWCEPCREELPALHRLAERASAGALVIAVSVGEPELRVRRFAEAVPVGFPILLDPERAAARAWRVTTLPTTYLLDRDLTPTLVAENTFAWDSLDLGKLIGHLDGRMSGDRGRQAHRPGLQEQPGQKTTREE